MKYFTSASQKRGQLAENLACMYLVRKGFRIIERNFTRKCGEIDIVAEKGGVIHFIEVKGVSRESLMRPEDNMHSLKQRKMARTVAVYLMSRDVLEWRCDLVCVFLDDVSRKARIVCLWDIILEY